MLQNSFYTTTSFQSTETGLEATLKLNPEHPILQGHFPGMPVVPGVCMLQMVKECLEQQLGRKLQLKGAKNSKFLSVLNPLEYDSVEVCINFDSSTDRILVSEATIGFAGTSFLKLQKASYQ